MKTVLALMTALLLPLSALAQEPEADYARYHRGLKAGNLDEVLRYTADVQRGEINSLAPEQRADIVKNLAFAAPASYAVRARSSDPGGVGVRLVLSGLRVRGSEKPEPIYGSIHMVNQRGEWRVVSSDWSTSEPEGLKPAPAAAAAAEKAAEKAAPPPKGSPPIVGSMDSAPVRKLGTAKEPCVYKPVMTAEDMERCK